MSVRKTRMASSSDHDSRGPRRDRRNDLFPFSSVLDGPHLRHDGDSSNASFRVPVVVTEFIGV